MPIQDLPQSSKMHAVPQNIMDVEFKLIGDLTMRQFTYILVNGLVAYFLYSTVGGIFKWPLVLFFIILGLAFAFVPIQERNLDIWVVNLIKAIYSPTQRIWRKEIVVPSVFTYDNINVVKQEMITLAPTTSRRKLEEYLHYQQKTEEVDPLDIPEGDYINRVREAFVGYEAPPVQPSFSLGLVDDTLSGVRQQLPQRPIRTNVPGIKAYTPPSEPDEIVKSTFTKRVQEKTIVTPEDETKIDQIAGKLLGEIVPAQGTFESKTEPQLIKPVQMKPEPVEPIKTPIPLQTVPVTQPPVSEVQKPVVFPPLSVSQVEQKPEQDVVLESKVEPPAEIKPETYSTKETFRTAAYVDGRPKIPEIKPPEIHKKVEDLPKEPQKPEEVKKQSVSFMNQFFGKKPEKTTATEQDLPQSTIEVIPQSEIHQPQAAPISQPTAPEIKIEQAIPIPQPIAPEVKVEQAQPITPVQQVTTVPVAHKPVDQMFPRTAMDNVIKPISQTAPQAQPPKQQLEQKTIDNKQENVIRKGPSLIPSFGLLRPKQKPQAGAKVPLEPITPDMHSGRRFINLLPSKGELILPIRGERVLQTSVEVSQEKEEDIKEKAQRLQQMLNDFKSTREFRDAQVKQIDLKPQNEQSVRTDVNISLPDVTPRNNQQGPVTQAPVQVPQPAPKIEKGNAEREPSFKPPFFNKQGPKVSNWEPSYGFVSIDPLKHEDQQKQVFKPKRSDGPTIIPPGPIKMEEPQKPVEEPKTEPKKVEPRPEPPPEILTVLKKENEQLNKEIEKIKDQIRSEKLRKEIRDQQHGLAQQTGDQKSDYAAMLKQIQELRQQLEEKEKATDESQGSGAKKVTYAKIQALTTKPNVVTGEVKDKDGKVLESTLVMFKNELGEPVRATKTNAIGQFVLSTPLSNGIYTIEVDNSNMNNLAFDIISLEVKGEVIPPIEIVGKKKLIMASQSKASTQEHLDILEIKNNLVIMKNGTACAVMQTTAVNFDLLSEIEQDAIIAAFSMLLNSITFPIQIILRSKRLDISKYVDKVYNLETKITDPLLRAQAEAYRKFVQDVIRDNEVLAKQFYVVVPMVTELTVEAGSGPFGWALQLVGAAHKRVDVDIDKTIKEADTQLSPKIAHVVGEFNRLGIKTRQLATQELVELFFDIYNPSTIHGQRIRTNIDDYTTAIVNPAILEE